MAELHLICREGLNVRAVAFPICESGNWEIHPEDADRVVGGTLHLHETKTKAAYFGGVVESWRYADGDGESSSRIVFKLRATAEAKDVPWRGAAHGMAWNGGVIG